MSEKELVSDCERLRLLVEEQAGRLDCADLERQELTRRLNHFTRLVRFNLGLLAAGLDEPLAPIFD